MTKKIPASYYVALAKELRKSCFGFDAADGYDLRHAADLTRGQRSKITRYANEVRALTSRENYPFRARNKSHLKVAQAVSQHSPGFPNIKIAFVPWTKPKGTKATRPELKFKGQTMTIETGNYRKDFIPFNKKKLITDADVEIARALAAVPLSATVMIQTGKYQIGNSFDKITVVDHVKKLMGAYDGKKQKPGTHNRKGKKDPAAPRQGKAWNPKHHRWQDWLNGALVYQFKPGGKGDNEKRLLQAMADSRKKSAKENYERRRRNAQLKQGKTK